VANPAPPLDDYLEHIEKAMKAHVEHGPEAGAAALAPIAAPVDWEPFRPAPIIGQPVERATRTPRPAYDATLVAQTFWRERFQCRYCGGTRTRDAATIARSRGW
jgi:hypothetical protein